MSLIRHAAESVTFQTADPLLCRGILATPMLFSKDYIGYLSKQVVRRLTEAKMVRTDHPAVLQERVYQGLLEELSLEDRINDEARVILESIQDDMSRAGASYPEMFKKIKLRLVQQYKAVL